MFFTEFNKSPIHCTNCHTLNRHTYINISTIHQYILLKCHKHLIYLAYVYGGSLSRNLIYRKYIYIYTSHTGKSIHNPLSNVHMYAASIHLVSKEHLQVFYYLYIYTWRSNTSKQWHMGLICVTSILHIMSLIMNGKNSYSSMIN